MSFSMTKLWRNLLQASVMVLLPVSVFAAEQITAQAAQSSPANVTPNNAMANNDSTGFDLSLPVDFKRCQMTSELNAYVDKLAPDDIAALVKVQKFLVECQGIMEQYLNKTQNKFSELKANAPAIEAAAKAIDEAEAEAEAQAAAQAATKEQ